MKSVISYHNYLNSVEDIIYAETCQGVRKSQALPRHPLMHTVHSLSHGSDAKKTRWPECTFRRKIRLNDKTMFWHFLSNLLAFAD